MALRFDVYRFIFVATLFYEFYLLHQICSVPFRLLVTGCDPDTEFLRFTLVTLFPLPLLSLFLIVRDEHDDRGDVGIAIDDDSVEQTFCHGERGSLGKQDRPLGYRESQCGESREISVDEFPVRFVAFPAGPARKRIFMSTVCLPGKFNLTLKRSRGIYVHVKKGTGEKI